VAEVKGGEKLQRALAAIAKAVGTGAVTLRVGFLETAKYPDGTPVAMAAAINEYGAPRARIPARSYFRTMIRDKSGEWPKAIAINLKATGYDVDRTLALVGEGIKGQLIQSIIATNSPPLRPITLMLRKWYPTDHSMITGRIVASAARAVAAGESYAGASTKPLVWSGHMLNSVDYDIKR
jgi:hypothetical protein